MEIYVSGRPHKSWGRRDDRYVQLKETPLPVSGRLLSRATVADRLEAVAKRRTRIAAAGMAIGTFASLVALAAGASDHLALLAFVAGVFVALNSMPATGRNRRALQRIDAHRWPAAGSEIRVTADAVIYNGETFAWADLEPVRLDLMSLPGDTDDTEVDSLEAQAGERRIVFHRYAYENGAGIVDAAYLRLVRERDPGV